MPMIGVKTLVFLVVILGSMTVSAQIQTVQQSRQDTAKMETPASVPAGNTQLSAPRNYHNIINHKKFIQKTKKA